MNPLYHAQLRRLLALVDMAMEDERMPGDVRERVLRYVLYGGAPNELDALGAH